MSAREGKSAIIQRVIAERDSLPSFETLLRTAQRAGTGECTHPLFQHERRHMERAGALWDAASARAILDSVERAIRDGNDPLEFLRRRVRDAMHTARLKGWDGTLEKR